MKRSPSLAVRIMGGQVVVIAVGALTLALTAAFLAPRLFTYHFAQTGEADAHVRDHAEQAFQGAFVIALVLGVVASVIGAGFLSWLLTRRISEPIEQLAQAAEAVAAGDYNVTVPRNSFGRELGALADAFDDMAVQLAATEESRRQLLADLAHELRTPAATLEAHIDGLEDGIVPGNAATYAVMRQQVARLQRLTSDIRTLTEIDAHALGLDPSPTSVGEIVGEACAAAARGFAAKGVTLKRMPCAHDSVVDVDPDRLQQVMANLLGNALRHTPTGGTVTVACSCTSVAAIVTVTDTGEAVFERFHRGDSSRHNDGEGSGLGLTIARGIVTDHGGTLIATSQGPGTGARLTMTLPVYAASTADG